MIVVLSINESIVGWETPGGSSLLRQSVLVNVKSNTLGPVTDLVKFDQQNLQLAASAPALGSLHIMRAVDVVALVAANVETPTWSFVRLVVCRFQSVRS
jgi:hypothetical protein